MLYELKYAEEYHDGRPTTRYQLRNITYGQMLKTVEFLSKPVPGTTIRFIVYDEKNRIVKTGEHKALAC